MASFSMNFKAKKQYGLKVPIQKLSVFSAAADDTADDKQRINRELKAMAEKRATKAKLEQSRLLQTDPNVYDYDGVYDEISEKRQSAAEVALKSREQEKAESKYIGALVDQAKIRQRENDRIYERILLKERTAEDALYENKEKFVTAAYKEKLRENKRWEAEDQRLADMEAKQDVTKRTDDAMAGFYANLLTKNIAMGGNAAEHATSAYTVGQKRKAVLPVEKVPAASAAIEQDVVKSKEQVIREARERFLARKKK